MKSNRSDGHGHWPAGKRRHPAGNWRRISAALQRLLDTQHKRGVVSRRVLADYLGVDEKAVRNWLAGTNRPDKETQEAIRKWVAAQRNGD